MMRVAGSSFITSTKTINPAVSRPPRISGTWIDHSVPPAVRPSAREAWSIEGVTFSMLASTVWSATDMKRTT